MKYKVTLKFYEGPWLPDGPLSDDDMTVFEHTCFSEDIKNLSEEHIAYLLARDEVLACGHLPDMDLWEEPEIEVINEHA